MAAAGNHTATRDMLKLAIPVLHVGNSRAAETVYCEKLGFRREFAYRPDGEHDDPCDMGIIRDGVWLHLSSFSEDGVEAVSRTSM